MELDIEKISLSTGWPDIVTSDDVVLHESLSLSADPEKVAAAKLIGRLYQNAYSAIEQLAGDDL
jgi:hypothetical protein